MLEHFRNSNLVIKSKYFYWYSDIIQHAMLRNSDKTGYYENHHIIPKSIFSKFVEDTSLLNIQQNKVLLTAKEHFIVHLLLSKMFSNSYCTKKMIFAISGLLYQKTKFQEMRYNTLNSKTYEYIKRQLIEHISGKNHWTSRLPEAKAKMNLTAKNRELSYSEEQKKQRAENISKATKGKPKSEEWKAKASLAMTGKKKTISKKLLDSRKKIKQEIELGIRKGNTAGITLPKVECPHCKTLCSKANLKRWHGDNCKSFSLQKT